MSAPDHKFSFNGINASNGQPLVQPLAPEQLVRLACGEPWDDEHLADLKEHHERISVDGMEVVFGVDPKSLSACGWGVIFPHDTSDEIRHALRPLLAHRRAAAGEVHEDLYRELAYRPGESKAKFLARHHVGPGPVNPRDLPYYLLLVGSPEEIPFSFQYQLDMQYAVGRIHFETAEEYSLYAQSVVTAETSPPTRHRTAAFFGVANRDDRATQRSVHNLVEPLAQHMGIHWAPGSEHLLPEQNGWTVEVARAEEATKERLGRLLGGGSTPALLFTASHGIGFDLDDPRQLPHQGALLCQDWPGPRRWSGRIPEEHYFCAEDVAERADLSGLIAFFFACYGAGTPQFDDFAHHTAQRKQIAPRSFLARLPQRLLAHPRGALAVVAHVDRAWSYSFDWPGAPRQLNVFNSTFGRLFDGYPIGSAMEFFNQRYAELSSDLSSLLGEVKYGDQPDLLSLPGLWTANNDARSYIVLGDPAVRLATR